MFGELLVNKKIGDSDEFEKMKKDIEFLKNHLRTKKDYEYDKTSLQKYNLDDKERRVLEYVKDNSGCNKQSVVEHFNNMDIPGLSRNPIFNIIKGLIERKYISKERDRHNKNTHKLFLKQDNIVVFQ